MYDHVLVPIVFDHGNQGGDALEIADTLVTQGGKVTLLHVIEDIPSYVMTYIPEGIRDTHHSDATEKLGAMTAELAADCEVAVIHGHASNSILDYASAHEADCIVIASHKPGFEDYFLGSTAARVVRQSKCAVHVVR